MKGLLPLEQEQVAKASMLLLLARAMNLGRSRAVQKARVAIRNGNVRMTLVSQRRVGVDLELWAIERDADYFREVFGRELSVAAA
jgi:exopolyphosphatase/guanosine-5'-triphosphate,3'-diphosphate pyrophosphatase